MKENAEAKGDDDEIYEGITSKELMKMAKEKIAVLMSTGEKLVEEEMVRFGTWYIVRAIYKKDGFKKDTPYRIVVFKRGDMTDMDYMNLKTIKAKKKGP